MQFDKTYELYILTFVSVLHGVEASDTFLWWLMSASKYMNIKKNQIHWLLKLLQGGVMCAAI